jgi:hypothetical protein
MRRKDVGRGFRILIKKQITEPIRKLQDESNKLINPSLAHVGTVALKAFHRLIRLKRFVSRFLRELYN